MQKYLKDLKPDKFNDLIAMNALYRPGPIAYIPNYIDRKHGREPIVFDLPEMEEYLGDTYGITVYQEQVMLLAQKLAGFSKGDADVLRKAMGKKQKSILDKMKSSSSRAPQPKALRLKRWKRSGRTGKPLRNTPSINRTPPVMPSSPTRRPISKPTTLPNTWRQC
jgi:DNA polymerase-3 subunit alpha